MPIPVLSGSGGIVSTVNSSTANLAGAAVFTGTSEDVSGYAHITISVFSSHASAINGLSIQQSPDGTNWDQTDVFTVPAATGKTFSAAVVAKFYRLVYTNGATLTTSLRIQTIFGTHMRKGSSVRPQDARANDNDFEEMLSFGMAFNGTDWDRIRHTLKGVQAGFGLAVQAMRDTGRNSRVFMLDAYTAAPVAETLQSVVQWYGNAAVAGTTTPAVVPAGKTLCLTNWALQTKALAAAGSAVMRIRANTAGVAVIGSPLVWSSEVGSKAAVAGLLDGISGAFPQGFEFPAGTGLGFTLAGYNATGVLTLMGMTRFQVYGFEY